MIILVSKAMPVNRRCAHYRPFLNKLSRIQGDLGGGKSESRQNYLGTSLFPHPAPSFAIGPGFVNGRTAGVFFDESGGRW